MKLTFKQLMREYVIGNINFDKELKVYNKEHIVVIEKETLGDILYFSTNLENRLYEIVKPKKKVFTHEYYYDNEETALSKHQSIPVCKIKTMYNWDIYKTTLISKPVLLETKEIEVDND